MNVIRCGSENRIIVGIGEMATSNEPHREIITFSLGSCLGISIYDPKAKVGGILHVLLPDSSIQKERAEVNPLMFVDTGVPRLFRSAYQLGASKENIIVKVAGGAEMQEVKISSTSDHGTMKDWWRSCIATMSEYINPKWAGIYREPCRSPSEQESSPSLHPA